MLLHIFLSLVHWTSGSQFFLPQDQDVTKTGNREQGMRLLTYIDVEMPHLSYITCRWDYTGLMFELLMLTLTPMVVVGA